VNPLTIVVVGTNVRSSAVTGVEHGQAEVALRRGASESENRNAYAACLLHDVVTIGEGTVITGRTGCLWHLKRVIASKQALILT